ncbi:MAG: hypothetical protein MJ124_09140 [Lachnospiraceae bacterium]|nr:hypothetical protein [Lachnospiraceae bacterium]
MVNRTLRLATALVMFVVGIAVLIMCIRSMTGMISTVTPESEYMGEAAVATVTVTPSPTPTDTP